MCWDRGSLSFFGCTEVYVCLDEMITSELGFEAYVGVPCAEVDVSGTEKEPA